MSCGIYKITNKINGHSYIGLSTNIEKRFKDHVSHLNSKRKDEKNKALYNAFRKHGVENFDFEIIELCDKECLKEREIYWIKHYNTYEDKSHYNLTPGGDLPGENNVHKGEDHGMAMLTEKDVVFCRKSYQQGLRSRDIHTKYFKDKISYEGFLKMWHGQTWKHIMPKVFEKNPHRGKYNAKDRDYIREKFFESGLSIRAFQKSEECYVGYGTLYNMINNPHFYDNK